VSYYPNPYDPRTYPRAIARCYIYSDNPSDILWSNDAEVSGLSGSKSITINYIYPTPVEIALYFEYGMYNPTADNNSIDVYVYLDSTLIWSTTNEIFYVDYGTEYRSKIINIPNVTNGSKITIKFALGGGPNGVPRIRNMRILGKFSDINNANFPSFTNG